MKELQNKILDLARLSNIIHDKNMVLRELVKIVYDEHKENTLKLFLEIQDLHNKERREELQEYYVGVQDGVHLSSHIARLLLEEKTSRKSRDMANELFNGDNIAHLINICKVYFPKGHSEGASNNGQWFFKKFKDMLLLNKEKYSSGGESRKWAKMYKHSDYIDLVINL